MENLGLLLKTKLYVSRLRFHKAITDQPLAFVAWRQILGLPLHLLSKEMCTYLKAIAAVQFLIRATRKQRGDRRADA